MDAQIKIQELKRHISELEARNKKMVDEGYKNLDYTTTLKTRIKTLESVVEKATSMGDVVDETIQVLKGGKGKPDLLAGVAHRISEYNLPDVYYPYLAARAELDKGGE